MEQKRKKPISDREKRLDELGKEWVGLSRTDDSSAWEAKWIEIWGLLFDTYYNGFKNSEAALNAFDKAVGETKESFAAYSDRFTLSVFFKTVVERRKIDFMKKENKQNPGLRIGVVGEDDEGGGIIVEPTGGDGGLTELEDESEADGAFFEIASAIQNFTMNHNKKTGNDTRQNYYRLFLTSDITSYIKGEKNEPHFQHRRDISRSMKGEFVNFCTVEACRSLSDIFWTDLKQYEAVVDNAGKYAGQPIPLPIPDTVGISYLDREENKKVSKSTYSRQRKAYRFEMLDALRSGGIIERMPEK